MRVGRGFGVVTGLAVFAVGVHGYHPFAEDGGVYGAGIKRVLDPGMYGLRPEFVLEQLRWPGFAHLVAGIVRMSHAPLEGVLLGLYCVSVWATLYGAWMIAARLTESVTGRCGAVALLACWLTLPIAGTSLMLVDPYLTARSFTTALVLIALAWVMDRSWRGWVMAGIALVVAGAMHPLMATYGLAAVVVLVGVQSWGRWKAGLGLGAIAVLIAAIVQMKAPAESAAYLWVERTRYYWFVSEWHWYEWLGLVAPLLILWGLARREEGAWLARAGLVLGVIAGGIAVGFARLGYATHLVARLQPLRCFQLVYVAMILLLGMRLGERVLRGTAWRWVVALALFGGTMFVVQRSTYPASAHFEWPGMAPRNEWEQAFLWVRANTPKDAVFAMDAHYIQWDDALCFRAIAERDALPDYSKDGGEASIMPSLTEAWVQGQAAQEGIEEESDVKRAAKLEPLGVGWVVMRVGSGTGFACPYANGKVKVCEVP